MNIHDLHRQQRKTQAEELKSVFTRILEDLLTLQRAAVNYLGEIGENPDRIEIAPLAELISVVLGYRRIYARFNVTGRETFDTVESLARAMVAHTGGQDTLTAIRKNMESLAETMATGGPISERGRAVWQAYNSLVTGMTQQRVLLAEIESPWIALPEPASFPTPAPVAAAEDDSIPVVAFGRPIPVGTQED